MGWVWNCVPLNWSDFLVVGPVQEFAQWYISDASEDNAVASSVVNLAAEVPSFLSVSEMKALTGLQDYSVGEVASLFAQFADVNGLLSPDAFESGFQAILTSRGLPDRCVCWLLAVPPRRWFVHRRLLLQRAEAGGIARASLVCGVRS
jgi:hypothetical protein